MPKKLLKFEEGEEGSNQILVCVKYLVIFYFFL